MKGESGWEFAFSSLRKRFTCQEKTDKNQKLRYEENIVKVKYNKKKLNLLFYKVFKIKMNKISKNKWGMGE